MPAFLATALLLISADQSDVVVTAPTRAAAEAFVGGITQDSSGQVSRFHTPVCPTVVGLGADAATAIRERIAETARGVGARADRNPRCSANLVLIVADDGRAYMNGLRSKAPAWLSGLRSSEIDALANQKSPARAWSVTSLRNEDGQDVVRPDPEESYAMRVMTASIVRLPTVSRLESTFVMIDRSAVVGKTYAQLADYAAMRGLAQTRPAPASGTASILNLFEQGAKAEAELTRSDIIYLQTLYRSKGTESAGQQRSQLAAALAGDTGRK